MLEKTEVSPKQPEESLCWGGGENLPGGEGKTSLTASQEAGKTSTGHSPAESTAGAHPILYLLKDRSLDPPCSLQRGWDQRTSKDPFQSKPFHHSTTLLPSSWEPKRQESTSQALALHNLLSAPRASPLLCDLFAMLHAGLSRDAAVTPLGSLLLLEDSVLADSTTTSSRQAQLWTLQSIFRLLLSLKQPGSSRVIHLTPRRCLQQDESRPRCCNFPPLSQGSSFISTSSSDRIRKAQGRARGKSRPPHFTATSSPSSQTLPCP